MQLDCWQITRTIPIHIDSELTRPWYGGTVTLAYISQVRGTFFVKQKIRLGSNWQRCPLLNIIVWRGGRGRGRQVRSKEVTATLSLSGQCVGCRVLGAINTAG